MQRSRLQKKLEAGRQVPGLFAPAGADFETPGAISWSAEHGAELELVHLQDPWPTDFHEQFTVHGKPHDGEPLTLLEARVATTTAERRTSRVQSWILALGDFVDSGDRWPRSNFRPSALHRWLPETGLKLGEYSEDGSRVVIEWNAPERRIVRLPDAEISLSPGASWAWSFSPSWSIETSMTFNVAPDDPLTITEHRELFGSPLLGFVVFASDRPDNFARESYYDPDTKRGVVVLRPGVTAAHRDWRGNPEDFLFLAEDVKAEDALQRWFEIWRKALPSIGLFADTISEGNFYSASRFLTLYTAAEGYWKQTKTGKDPWSPKALAKRAGVSTTCTGASSSALALIGASREYHAHLGLQEGFNAKEIVDQTYESTRRLHALVQACLLRELGVSTDEIERLLDEHYRSWPIP